jgi:hypothetical protein
MAPDSSLNQGATAGLPSSAPPAPPIIHELVAKFTEHSDAYKRGDYNETQLRRGFLDPFFAAMGWDFVRINARPLNSTYASHRP